MKALKSLILLLVVLSGCGSDSKTNGTGQIASNVGTYVSQCTYRKKVTNPDMGKTQDFTWYQHAISWVTVVNEDSDRYQEKSYESDVDGKKLPDAKVYYAIGESKVRKLSDTELESTDIAYDADSSFSITGNGTYKNVDLWRKDSDSMQTLLSHSYNGELKKVDVVKTTETVDDSTWIHTYTYPSPEQMSSGNQRVLEYSKSCVETYMDGRVE